MAGWIKFEKDLTTDPRVMRMAKALTCNAPTLPGVTLVCGALVRLWVYADSHARDDDTLDLGPAEIDELVGIPGFTAAMPLDWLREIDERTVELPGFQSHNGTEAKKRALTQKRVARHRSGQQRPTVTTSNASALPDLDQTKTKTSTKRAAARPSAPPDGFAEFRAAYPKRAGSQRWGDAERAYAKRLAEGHTPEAMLAGAKRYAALCAATDRIGRDTVQQAATFLGENRAFLEEFGLPPKPKPGARPGDLPKDPDAELMATAKTLGYAPSPGETQAEFLARFRPWNERRIAKLQGRGAVS